MHGITGSLMRRWTFEKERDCISAIVTNRFVYDEGCDLGGYHNGTLHLFRRLQCNYHSNGLQAKTLKVTREFLFSVSEGYVQVILRLVHR